MKNEILLLKGIFIIIILIWTSANSVNAQSCLPDGIAFTTQSQIDSFQIIYPGCTRILGDVIIEESSSGNIINMNGLSQVTSIGGFLRLIYIVGLTNLSGLDNLTSIGRLNVQFNGALTSLSGMDNVTSIGGEIGIRYNNILTSLSGLGNIDYSTITDLDIINCPNLSMCEVNSICDYLENGGSATVENNASGCNSVSEVEAACLVPVEELYENDGVIFYPNPTNGIIQIDGNHLEDWELNVWNTTGILLKRYQIIENGQIDISQLPCGMYFLELRNKDQVFVEKIIKE